MTGSLKFQELLPTFPNLKRSNPNFWPKPSNIEISTGKAGRDKDNLDSQHQTKSWELTLPSYKTEKVFLKQETLSNRTFIFFEDIHLI
jgi:hypothetical protein